MKHSRILLMFVTAVLVIGLTACVRSLAPEGQQDVLPTATGGLPGAPAEGEAVAGDTGVATSDVMAQLEMFATQTVMASLGITGTLPTVPPPPVDAQLTPVPGGDQSQPVTEPPASGQPTPGGEQQPGVTPEAAVQQPAATPEASPPPPGGQVQPSEPQPAAPQTPPIVVPTATPGRPQAYTLHTGEHVYCIARRFDVNPSELLALNGLGAQSIVFAGMELKIPQTGNTFPGSRSLQKHPTTHVVSQGETIYSIACQYGEVSPDAIAYANNLSAPYRVSPGDKLNIP